MGSRIVEGFVMRTLETFPRIFLYTGITDFRKRRRSLAAFVSSELNEDVFAGTLFLFCNKHKNCVRALYWDKTGFALWEKELAKDKFKWPKKTEESQLILNAQEVCWLLEGIDLEKLKPHKELKYSFIA